LLGLSAEDGVPLQQVWDVRRLLHLEVRRSARTAGVVREPRIRRGLSRAAAAAAEGEVSGPQGVSIESFKATQLNDQLEGIDGTLKGIDGTLWAIRDELRNLVSILEAYTSK
jgi:hypothetical protein